MNDTDEAVLCQVKRAGNLHGQHILVVSLKL